MSECICSSLRSVCQESPELPEEGRCLILTRTSGTFEDLRLLLTFFTCSDSIKTEAKKKKAVHKKPLGEHVLIEPRKYALYSEQNEQFCCQF